MLTPFQKDLSIDWYAYDELVEWYLRSGAAGLFSVCLSSELFQLTLQERIDLAKSAIKRTNGRVPVIAAGAIGTSVDELADQTNRIAETGVDAVVCIVNQFVSKERDETDWKKGVERFLQRVDDSIPLGLYECPQPYHRLLSPETLLWAAETSRFHFHKDTCCNAGEIRRKIELTQASNLGFFNANSETLLESLRMGAKGFSGIAANFYPQFYVWLCDNYDKEPEIAEELQRFMSASDRRVLQGYPAGAKLFLRMCGLRLESSCRVPHSLLAENEEELLRSFLVSISNWNDRLQLKKIVFSEANAEACFS